MIKKLLFVFVLLALIVGGTIGGFAYGFKKGMEQKLSVEVQQDVCYYIGFAPVKYTNDIIDYTNFLINHLNNEYNHTLQTLEKFPDVNESVKLTRW